MAKVKWESRGKHYRAEKFDPKEQRVIAVGAGLLGEGFLPTIVIGDVASLHQAGREGLDILEIYCEVDRRCNGMCYMVYKDLIKGEMEALEFAGLDELP